LVVTNMIKLLTDRFYNVCCLDRIY
jgi:hypothetical protein